MTYWIFKYSLTAISATGSLLGCSYCTALLATLLCVTVAERLGEFRARQVSACKETSVTCGSIM